MLAGYSALNFGHRNPVLVAAAERQLGRLTLTSRAFHNDLLGTFGRELAALCGMDAILPMNTGAEAVETAVKMARKWGYEVKGVPEGRATIVVMGGNFHGRTTTIISFSDDPVARAGFGPYTPGFVSVPYGDAVALAEAIDENTVAVLLEPIQGEGGVIIPPDGFLAEVRRLCTERNVLMLADEIQSGLGRTGMTFACDHEGVVPDAYILGKALGGGILPVSAVVARSDVMGVFHPGEHGSTFGGNPLACAVGIEVVRMLATGEPQARARELGARPAGAPGRPAGAPRVGGAFARPVGRHRHRRADGSRRVRGPDAPWGARQGHPRVHDPARAADRRGARGPRVGDRAAARGAGGVAAESAHSTRHPRLPVIRSGGCAAALTSSLIVTPTDDGRLRGARRA